MPSHLTSRTSHPLGYGPNLALVRRIKGKDSIRLPQLNLLNDNGFRLIIPWLRHSSYFSLTKYGSSGLPNPLFIKMSLSFKRQAATVKVISLLILGKYFIGWDMAIVIPERR